MLKSITVTNFLGDSLTMNLRRPELCGLIVKEVTGLGAPEASINITDMASGDGAFFNSARLNSRNIVLQLKYMRTDTLSIEQSRMLTYKYFPIKKKCTLTFETDEKSLKAVGYVETNEATIFSDQSGCEISIVCPDPYMYAIGQQVTNVFGISPLVSFPLGEEYDTDSFELSSIDQNKDKSVLYEGDADTGMLIKVHCLPGSYDFLFGLVIYNRLSGEKIAFEDLKLISTTGIQPLDDIYISTVRGNKYCKLIRSGVEYNIINGVSKDSSWLQLTKGDNIITFSTRNNEFDKYVQMTIYNDVVYQGV